MASRMVKKLKQIEIAQLTAAFVVLELSSPKNLAFTKL
jgi:hypothetical protein